MYALVLSACPNPWCMLRYLFLKASLKLHIPLQLTTLIMNACPDQKLKTPLQLTTLIMNACPDQKLHTPLQLTTPIMTVCPDHEACSVVEQQSKRWMLCSLRATSCSERASPVPEQNTCCRSKQKQVALNSADKWADQAATSPAPRTLYIHLVTATRQSARSCSLTQLCTLRIRKCRSCSSMQQAYSERLYANNNYYNNYVCLPHAFALRGNWVWAQESYGSYTVKAI
jgi:hypothetical protein